MVLLIKNVKGSEILELRKRKGVYVYLKHLRLSKQLRKFGTILYVSRKMKYVLLYIDEEVLSENLSKMQALKYVTKIELSPRDEIAEDLEEVRGTANTLLDEEENK